jgi:hypothetical protein
VVCNAPKVQQFADLRLGLIDEGTAINFNPFTGMAVTTTLICGSQADRTYENVFGNNLGLGKLTNTTPT